MQEKMTIAQRVTYVLSGEDNKIVTELTTEEFEPQKIEDAILNDKVIWVKGAKTLVMINPKYLAAVLIENKEVEL